jgi:hypothetical protein
MDKKELRETVSLDVADYIASGGHIEILKSQKVKQKNSAKGKQKMTFFGREPVNHPTNAWNLI